jgi:hypothetical protein
MAKRTAKSIQQLIKEARLQIIKIEDKLRVQTYLETMPEYDPVYKYCYSISNYSIPYQSQSVAAWLQAVAQHMHKRKPGHGGEENFAFVVDIPQLNSEVAIDAWLAWIAADLKKRAKSRIRIQHERQSTVGT